MTPDTIARGEIDLHAVAGCLGADWQALYKVLMSDKVVDLQSELQRIESSAKSQVGSGQTKQDFDSAAAFVSLLLWFQAMKPLNKATDIHTKML
ncbi:unnamed protein product [Protopolystoma xenopodis]|uniref:Uncharacterized protein n=1 Tax=Protopolystoma xenopodis TaxID=117903 RepID=A0A448WLN7_9PLAT|nr:unnamed protein product [Protopolystoma xenopodis]